MNNSYFKLDLKDNQILKANDSGDDHDSKSYFVATNEWQEIKEGQIVPSGLHYRMNLATGLKEAKLLESAVQKRDLELRASKFSLSHDNIKF